MKHYLELIENITCDQPVTVIPMLDSENLQADSFEEYTNTEIFQNFEAQFKDVINRFSEKKDVEMVEILLNTLYATRTGNWHLYLECIRDVIPYTFSHDNFNYVRYLTPIFGTMLELEKSHPYICENFKQGFLTVQLTEGKQFSRVEPDKVIEMTVNIDCKTSGGTTGFSQNSGAVHRWEFNATYRAGLRRSLLQHTSFKQPPNTHSDLLPSRIKKDQTDISNIIALLNDTFVHPFSSSELVSISSGVTVSMEFVDEVLSQFLF